METSNKSETQADIHNGDLQSKLEKKVQEFNLQRSDGKTYRLSDYKGKKVYLKFWASWCLYLPIDIRDTNELAKAEAGKDYVVLSVVAPTFNGEKSEADFKTGTSLWITRISQS